MSVVLRSISPVLVVLLLLSTQGSRADRVEVRMSNVTTQQEDAYICTSYKLTDYQNYITNIEALATSDIAHHMFGFGCEKPASLSNSWNCGNVVCQGQKTILFAWGRNAPALELPKDVAFKVGRSTPHKYIVVNIHYLKKVSNDRSGLALTFSNTPRLYQAGIMLMVSGYIAVPPKTKKYSSDLSCKYEGKNIKVFAYRVHAHMHGDVNTAYRIRNHEWSQLAKGDPQWPQAFYPTNEMFDLKDGDALVGRCTYHNDESRTIYAGPTHKDEMCNIYLMYYTDDITDVQDTCSGHIFPQLESIMPEDSTEKPNPPDSFTLNKEKVKKYTNAENWYSYDGFGQVSGIAINQKSDSIVVFHRGSQIWNSDSFDSDFQFNTRKYNLISENTIVTLDRNTGKVKGQSWGANMFYMPHSISLDSEGNTWVSDVGRHQVLKFDKGNTGRPSLEIGVRMVSGSDQRHLCQPTDIAVLRSGDFFVADGYCNSRIIKFNKNGEYLTEWSSEDEKMPSHFFVPHSLALNEKANLLCVADRENYRVQCFDLNGNNLLQVNLQEYGPIYSVAFAANNASVLYVVNGYNSVNRQQYDKKILLVSTKSGKILGSINLAEDAVKPHDLKLSDDASEIYVANLDPIKLFKYVLVKYKIGTGGSGGSSSGQTDNIDLNKDNFRTSMFIMAFLAFPLIIIGLIGCLVRLKNMGKLNKGQLDSVGKNLEKNQKKFGKWISSARNKKKRNGGFTRLNQESDNEECEKLNRTSNSDTESESDEIGIKMPTLSSKT